MGISFDKMQQDVAATGSVPTSGDKPKSGIGKWLKSAGSEALGSAAAGAAGFNDMLTFGYYPKLVRALSPSTADAMEANRAEHPVANLIGEVGGGLAPGFGMEAAAMKAIGSVKTGGKALVDFLRNTKTGRAVSSTALGSADATTRAIVNEEPIAPAAAGGAVGGLLGQAVLGEALPGVLHHFTNSNVPTSGAKLVMEHAARREGKDAFSGADIDSMIARRQMLGENAGMPDMGKGLTDVARAFTRSDAMKTPNLTQQNVMGFDDKMAGIVGDYQTGMQEAFPNDYRVGPGKDRLANPRHILDIEADTKANREALQKDYDWLLDSIQKDNDPMFRGTQIYEELFGGKDFSEASRTVSAAKKSIESDMRRLVGESQKTLKRVHGEGAEAEYDDYMSPRAMLALRKDIDKQINIAMEGEIDQRDMELAMHLMQAKNKVTSMLEAGLGDEFTRLNRDYSNEFSYTRNAKLAREMMQKGGDIPEQSARAAQILLEGSTPAEQMGFAEGASGAIIDMLKKDGMDVGSARKVLKSDDFKSKLVSFFGEDAALNVMQVADNALSRAGTAKKLSKDDPLDLTPQLESVIEKAVKYGILAGGLGRIAGAVKGGASYAATAGVAQRSATAARKHLPDSEVQYADEMLSKTGLDADKALVQMQDLAMQAHVPSRSLAGRGAPSFYPNEYKPKLNEGGLLSAILGFDVGTAPAISVGGVAGDNTNDLLNKK